MASPQSSSLLYRFFYLSSGAITIDGHDLRSVTLNSFRGGLGIVPQDPKLFNRSILENVRYARLDATDEEIYNACEAVAMHTTISSLSNGYQSRVGEGGLRLSGGQRQLLAIAQALLLRHSKIILLDEATSALDSLTEAHIHQVFQKLRAGRTMFIIAHRLASIIDVDMIPVMENGEIVEKGTHNELLN